MIVFLSKRLLEEKRVYLKIFFQSIFSSLLVAGTLLIIIET